MTIYINGFKASKEDIRQLEKQAKASKIKLYAKTTKKGNIAYRTVG